MNLDVLRPVLRARGLTLAVVAALVGASGPAVAADVPDASPAERLVFMQPHLANLKPPRQLQYQYVRDAEGEARQTDRMTLDFRGTPSGACCAVEGTFMSGPRAMALPPIDEASSNPMLLYFLEFEVRELNRLTKGQSAHFRKRIRQALVDAAQVSPVTIRWDGRDVAAQEVRIRPYLDDPFRDRFEKQARKEYAFVLSDAVPGGVYQIHTLVPSARAGGPPELRETLTLAPTLTPALPRK